MSDIKVNDKWYRIGKMPAIAQFHVARRLGPMLIVAGVTVEMLREGMRVNMSDLVAMAGPVSELLAKMSDDEVEYILFSCLKVVTMQQEGDKWAPLLTPDGKTLMFSNLEMPELIRVALEVLKDNLGNFLTALTGGADSAMPSDLRRPESTSP